MGRAKPITVEFLHCSTLLMCRSTSFTCLVAKRMFSKQMTQPTSRTWESLQADTSTSHASRETHDQPSVQIGHFQALEQKGPFLVSETSRKPVSCRRQLSGAELSRALCDL